METLKHILWPIVVVGGLGAFIDFVIGNRGQERAKNFLLEWWVRFEDVRWSNFGRIEALYAVDVMDRWFGVHTWSFRRVIGATFTGILFSAIGYIFLRLRSSLFSEYPLNAILMIAISFIGFCASISLTRLVTWKMATLCGISQLRNITIFVIMLCINYVLLAFWIDITDRISDCVMFVGLSFMSGYYKGGIQQGCGHLVTDIILDLNGSARGLLAAADRAHRAIGEAAAELQKMLDELNDGRAVRGLPSLERGWPRSHRLRGQSDAR